MFCRNAPFIWMGVHRGLLAERSFSIQKTGPLTGARSVSGGFDSRQKETFARDDMFFESSPEYQRPCDDVLARFLSQAQTTTGAQAKESPDGDAERLPAML